MFWRKITLCSRWYKIFFKCWWKKNVFTTLHCNKIICEHKKGSITTSTSSMIKSNKNSISASFDVQSIVMYTFANKCLDLNPINLKMFYVKDESKEAIYLNWLRKNIVNFTWLFSSGCIYAPLESITINSNVGQMNYKLTSMSWIVSILSNVLSSWRLGTPFNPFM